MTRYEAVMSHLSEVLDIDNLDSDNAKQYLRDLKASHDRVVEALKTAIKVADQAREQWDKAPHGMRTGKILIALSGHCPGYRPDTDAIHAALKAAEALR